MKKIILHQAYEELNGAVEYYEKRQAGLGLRMIHEFDKHVKWIMQNPGVIRIRKGGYQRINLKIFPYYIAFMIHNDTLWILAIAHGYRTPEYWIKRSNEIT